MLTVVVPDICIRGETPAVENDRTCAAQIAWRGSREDPGTRSSEACPSGKRLHTRNRHLRNRSGSSVAFSNGFPVACSNGCSLVQWRVSKDCRLFSGFRWSLSMNVQWHFPIGLHFCEFWCAAVCPDSLCPRASQPSRIRIDLGRTTKKFQNYHLSHALAAGVVAREQRADAARQKSGWAGSTARACSRALDEMAPPVTMGCCWRCEARRTTSASLRNLRLEMNPVTGSTLLLFCATTRAPRVAIG